MRSGTDTCIHTHTYTEGLELGLQFGLGARAKVRDGVVREFLFLGRPLSLIPVGNCIGEVDSLLLGCCLGCRCPRGTR